MKTKKVIASLTLGFMMFSTAASFAADRDVWVKASETLYAPGLEILKDDVKRLEVLRNSENYYFEANGHLFDFAKVNAEFAKDQAGFMANLKPAEAVKPVPAGGLKVEAVNAITRTEVEVELKEALAEDMPGADLTVVDNNGATVAVKKQDLAAGAKLLTFQFEKSLTKDPEGKWTVNGVVKDFDLEKKLKAVKDAGDDQLKLKAALEALEIKNIDPAKYPGYAKKNREKVGPYKSVEEVQKMIDDVNLLDEDAVVKAVLAADAANNAVAMAEALSNPAFVKVNPAWAASYIAGISSAPPVDDTIKKIQAKIYAANDTALLVAGVLTTTGIDRAKLEKSRQMVMDYAEMKADGVTPKTAAVATEFKKINIQLALCNVLEATTPSLLEAKVQALRELDPANLTDDYIAENADDYMAAIAAANADDKDTVAELDTIITDVNDSFGKMVAKEGAKAQAIAGAQPEFVIQALNKRGKPFAVAAAAAITGISVSGLDGTYMEVAASNFTVAPTSESVIKANAANVNLTAFAGKTLNVEITFTVGGAAVPAINKEHTVSTTLQVLPADINAGQSAMDLAADKPKYKVGETMTFTFTLKDTASNVVEIDGESEVFVKENGAADILAKNGKATISKGKVTVTAVADKVEAATRYDLVLTDLDPALTVQSAGGNTIEIEAGAITRFKAEKGTKGVKLTAYSGMGADTVNNENNIVLKNVKLTKLGTPNVEVTLDTLIGGQAIFNTNVSGEADNLFTTTILAGTTSYELIFTYNGQEFKITFTTP